MSERLSQPEEPTDQAIIEKARRSDAKFEDPKIREIFSRWYDIQIEGVGPTSRDQMAFQWKVAELFSECGAVEASLDALESLIEKAYREKDTQIYDMALQEYEKINSGNTELSPN